MFKITENKGYRDIDLKEEEVLQKKMVVNRSGKLLFQFSANVIHYDASFLIEYLNFTPA